MGKAYGVKDQQKARRGNKFVPGNDDIISRCQDYVWKEYSILLVSLFKDIENLYEPLCSVF